MRVVVVGTGPSGVHCALTLLRKGHEVVLIDGGRTGPVPPAPDTSFNRLKDTLPDPARYFLGDDLSGITLPSTEKEYYGIPPDKEYIFDVPDTFRYRSSGFEPLFSFARGGLAQTWTGGCYPFNDAELAAFPFGCDELMPYYAEVAKRIGITGESDDLARFFPLHDGLMPPLRLDPHSTNLMEKYGKQRAKLNERHGFYMGRTRVATLSRDMNGRQACAYLGRCLIGCPRDALYTPSYTLRECIAFDACEYRPGFEVRRLRIGPGGRATGVWAAPVDGGDEVELTGDRVVLAAGALGTTWIVLSTVLHEDGEVLELSGLMDNRQVLVPFLNLGMLGKEYAADSYQYHLLGIGLDQPAAREYVHGQVTTLTTALMHPIIQKLPLDLRSSAAVARVAHAALGLVNLNFHDERRDDCRVSIEPGAPGRPPTLLLSYVPSPAEPARLRRAIQTLKAGLGTLGCIVPPGMTHIRPMGASVHYAGTLPMSDGSGPWTTTSHGESRAWPGLFIADGATYPFLPAKNITFTLMANAVRLADQAF